MTAQLDMMRTYLDGRVYFSNFKGIRLVNARDSTGEVCECLLVPVEKNGLFRNKKGDVQIKFHGVVRDASKGIFSEYRLFSRVGTRTAVRMEERGEIDTARTRSWGISLGVAQLVLPVGRRFCYIKNKVGDLDDPENPYARFNTEGMKKTRDEHGNPIEGADRSRVVTTHSGET